VFEFAVAVAPFLPVPPAADFPLSVT
jgi:hypothetical protein